MYFPTLPAGVVLRADTPSTFLWFCFFCWRVIIPVMRLSFVVSAFDRPVFLRGCLSSLLVQQGGPYEIIVTDNSEYGNAVPAAVCMALQPRPAETLQFRGVRTNHIEPCTCYSAANHAVKDATGDFLCFPSEDSYYVPSFARIMLAKADEGFDLVYCDMLDTRLWPEYRVFSTAPLTGSIDKTGFIIRKDFFDRIGGFPGDLMHPFTDGHLVDLAVKSGAKIGKAPGVLLVHN